MTNKPARLPRAWPFLALFVLVYLAGLGSLRFVLDDWCQIPRLAGLMGGEAPGWRGIVDNQWVGNPRIFFLTWLLQGAWARIWGLGSSAPYFLAAFAAHLASCLLLGRLLRRAGLGEGAADAAALACLVTPTSSSVLFWINCWQFVLPVTGCLICVELYTNPLGRRWADLAALTFAAVCTQFLGEQALPVLYAGFAWALLDSWRRAPARALVPAAAAALSLAYYYLRCVSPLIRPENAGWSWSAVGAGLRESAAIHAGAFSPFSAYFGKGSVAPSLATWSLVAAVAAALAWRRLREEPRDGGRRPEAPLLPFLFGAAAVFVLCQLPAFAGIAKGLRSFEYRYTYASGLALAAALIFAVRAAAGAGRARAAAAVEAVLIAYLAGLTIYDLRDIWGGQKRLDERIWAEIDARYRPGLAFVMTDSQTMASLMPARSGAISDFKDDFAIACRLRAVGKAAPDESLHVTRRYQSKYDYGAWMYLPAYRENVFRAAPDRVLPVVFRYGPSFSDMLAGDVRVFSDFEAYKRFRADEKIHFVPWEISVP